jgi:NAD(P)-dependent dehydrogenase (short-subunit alcohol dehydrogenase family)
MLLMEIRLDGKVALVTGGSRGLGRAIAAAFREAGASVMISSRKAENLQRTATALGGDIAWFAANAGDDRAATACVEATIERFGRVDILVNNAATNPYRGPIVDLDKPRADKTIAVNQWGPLVWTQAVWRASMEERGGAILNIVSGGAFGVVPMLGWYGATKAALVHLTNQLANELAPKVRVNAISPGFIKTDMNRATWERTSDEELALRSPLRRLGAPEDVANAAVFLVSDIAGWITGQTLTIDGGGSVSTR